MSVILRVYMYVYGWPSNLTLPPYACVHEALSTVGLFYRPEGNMQFVWVCVMYPTVQWHRADDMHSLHEHTLSFVLVFLFIVARWKVSKFADSSSRSQLASDAKHIVNCVAYVEKRISTTWPLRICWAGPFARRHIHTMRKHVGTYTLVYAMCFVVIIFCARVEWPTEWSCARAVAAAEPTTLILPAARTCCSSKRWTICDITS